MLPSAGPINTGDPRPYSIIFYCNPLQSMNQEIRIREAKPTDLEYILHHRRQMFYDMGHQDAGELDAMVATSRPYFAQGLADVSYLAWMAEDGNGRVVAGG